MSALDKSLLKTVNTCFCRFMQISFLCIPYLCNVHGSYLWTVLSGDWYFPPVLYSYVLPGSHSNVSCQDT